MVDKQELFFGVNERYELVSDEIWQLLNLCEAGVMPQRMRQSQK